MQLKKYYNTYKIKTINELGWASQIWVGAAKIRTRAGTEILRQNEVGNHLGFLYSPTPFRISIFIDSLSLSSLTGLFV